MWSMLLVLVALAGALAPLDDAEARRGFSGFGRTSFRAAGFGRGASKALSRRGGFGWGRSSRRVGRASTTGGRRPAGWTGGNMSRRVGTKGRVFDSRGAAEGAYRKSLKTRWTSKPARRPDYVPRTVSRDGRSYDVSFRNGTYGYMGAGNAWVALGAANMLATGALLGGQGYYYGTPNYGGPFGGGVPLFLVALAAFALVSRLGRVARMHVG